MDLYNSLLVTLVLGGYGFTIIVYGWLRDDIRELRDNHYKHIEAHLKGECGEDCEFEHREV